MPTNSNASLRYRILDRCFSDTHHKYTIDVLLDIINDNIQNIMCAFSVFLRSRISDYFNLLNHGCGDGFENLVDIAAGETGIRMAVTVNFKVTAAFDLYIILSVNRDHWHFPKHLKGVLGLGIVIVLNIIR